MGKVTWGLASAIWWLPASHHTDVYNSDDAVLLSPITIFRLGSDVSKLNLIDGFRVERCPHVVD